VTAGAKVLTLGHTIHRLGEVVSTQIEAARLAAEGASEGTVVTATHQSAGRGRRGRKRRRVILDLADDNAVVELEYIRHARCRE